MDASEFTATVREERATELDRLGSEKALVAATDARLDADRVLASAARTERRAAETFDRWAESAATDEVRDAFERVADRERAHHDRIAEHVDGTEDADAVDADAAADPDALHAYLRELDDSVERVAAGMVARPLVASRSLLQTINFFVNEADESAAATFREIRSETDAMADDGAELLESICGSDDDWERAERAALETVDRAYREYADSLENLGIDPKPVC